MSLASHVGQDGNNAGGLWWGCLALWADDIKRVLSMGEQLN